MRASSLLAGLLATLLPVSAALAQANRAPARAGESVRYIALYGDILGDLASDAVVRETRQGGRVTSAVLDICHSVSATSARKDRFVIDLRPEGGKLVGSGQSQEDRQPIAVSLTRTQSGQSFSFEGTIRRGATVYTVSAPDNSDMSEKEFREAQPSDEEIVAEPADFTQVAPTAIAVRVKREALLDFVAGLRGRNLKVGYGSLAADCADLRAGHQVVRIEADAERAPQLVDSFRRAPGVVAAGWIAGTYGIERAVRIPAAPWRTDGKLDRDRLAAALADHVGKALSATLGTATWDAITGDLTLKFKRADQAVPGLGLTELLDVTFLIGPEKPGASDHAVIWIGESAIESADESAGPRLNLTGTDTGNGEEARDIDVEAVLSAVAKGLNGEQWNAESSSWQ